jgi:FkbM family methyltransferase
MNEIHPVFAHFPPYSGVCEQGFSIDFLGSKVRTEFVSGAVASGTNVTTQYPPLDEEYFEWIDILESVRAAKEKYTMVELGAGYGRWAVRAACAARRCRPDLPFHLVAVEAEPKHFEWMKRHFRDNQVDPRQHTLVRAAVGDKAGTAMFYVGSPESSGNVAADWYGQALTKSYEEVEKRRFGRYEGFRVLKFKSGWRAIETECVVLGKVIGDLTRVDLIDMDVQGAELKVVGSSMDLLDRTTVRMHIGTHDREIEAGLRELLRAHRWECLADYSCLGRNETPWGPVEFSDGVQSWVNPRLR